MSKSIESTERGSVRGPFTLDGTPLSDIREGMKLRWVNGKGEIIVAKVIVYHGAVCVDNAGEYRPVSSIIEDAELIPDVNFEV